MMTADKVMELATELVTWKKKRDPRTVLAEIRYALDEIVTATSSQRRVDYDVAEALTRSCVAAMRAEVDNQRARADQEHERAEALERELCEARRQPADGDIPLPKDAAIEATHATGDHATYREALRLVEAWRSKGGLVALVAWLLTQRLAQRDGGRT